MTINDYLKMVNELRNLGQPLMIQHLDECEEHAACVD